MSLTAVSYGAAPLHPLARELLGDLGAADPVKAAEALSAIREAGFPPELLRLGLGHPSARVRVRCQRLLQLKFV